MTVRGAGRRPSSWLAAGAGLALAGTVPLLALLLLLRRPSLDVRWEHHPAHFWLVLGAAALSALSPTQPARRLPGVAMHA